MNDEVWFRPEPMTRDDVEELVSRLAIAGCTTLLIRTGCLGILPYWTDLSWPMRFDAGHARRLPTSEVPDVEGYIALRREWTEKYARVLEDFNPPQAFFEAAHRHGLKAIAWMDIFDDGYPGYRSKFLDTNPHCHWTARDGTHFTGLMSYAWPEARAFRVQQARELLEMGADGIHCSTSAHGRHLEIRSDEDAFGYEEPIVSAFLERHGVDIRTRDDFDREAWHDIKAEAMVTLYRELSALCRTQGAELWAGTQLGRYMEFNVAPHFSVNCPARYTNPWRKLVEERIVDALIVGDYEILTYQDHDYWSAKQGIDLTPGEDLYAWAARTFLPVCEGRAAAYLFSEWLPGNYADLRDRLQFFAEKVRMHGFGGVDVHEAWSLEAVDGGFEAFARAMRFMKAP